MFSVLFLTYKTDKTVHRFNIDHFLSNNNCIYQNINII